MLNDPLISVAICTYDRYDLFEAALASLRQQTLPAHRYQIIVVDNSPDAARARVYLQKYDNVDNIRYIHIAVPGLSNARNIAAQQCRTDFIAYMDDDAVAESDWLESLLAAFAKFGDKAAAVGGPVLPIWQDERPNWLSDELLDCLTIIDWKGGLRIADEREWAAGANMAFRTTALLEAGAFPTGLGRKGAGEALLSNEEIELQSRLRAADHWVIWAPGAKVRHLIKSERLQQAWLRRRLAWQAVSDLLRSDGARSLDGAVYWQRLVKFINELPPRLRTPRGLFAEMHDPEDFAKQVHANYDLTMLLLLGHDAADAGGPSRG